MKNTLRTKRAVVAAGVAGTLFLLVLGYLVVISPQRSKAADLSAQIEQTEQQLLQAEIASRTPAEKPPRVDLSFRLAKAMPSETDMPGILLELSRVAEDTGISFDSITPQDGAGTGNYQVLPIGLSFTGNFYELSDFLFRLRNLVAVRDGRLDARGRLFAVDSINFAQQPDKPGLTATLTASAFVYGNSAAPTGTAPATAAPSSTAPAPAAGAPPAGSTTGGTQ